MSKFDYDVFWGGYDRLAVSKEKYSKDEAINLAKFELAVVDGKPYDLAIGSAFVRHRAGVNEDYEPCVCWWLEYTEHKRSCPVWVFHRNRQSIDRDKYEYIQINGEKEADQ